MAGPAGGTAGRTPGERSLQRRRELQLGFRGARQDVEARGEDLAELDEGRPEAQEARAELPPHRLPPRGVAGALGQGAPRGDLRHEGPDLHGTLREQPARNRPEQAAHGPWQGAQATGEFTQEKKVGESYALWRKGEKAPSQT